MLTDQFVKETLDVRLLFILDDSAIDGDFHYYAKIAKDGTTSDVQVVHQVIVIVTKLIFVQFFPEVIFDLVLIALKGGHDIRDLRLVDTQGDIEVAGGGVAVFTAERRASGDDRAGAGDRGRSAADDGG